ncbi:polysaccharide deacetylase family protein [Marinimicrobium alkaliphilum]|uniref:polysaccharide deacetylase family protein n=1 Tax=Marinimicrobium alkaliphilum TaxID=2202654 RepID=UPI000DBA7760|nr:polysaccharide deacetylase family protein [Marinimicrobium alkaliphilum]
MVKALIKKPLKPVLTSLASRYGAHRQHSATPRLWVLMYHRILPVTDERYHLEEPGMRVTPESFEMHLQQLRKHFELVSLKDWVSAREEGRELPPKACAITFDDGWRDNYEYAFPLLKQYNAPATLFAVVDKIGTDFQFWPNIVASLLLSGAGSRFKNDPVLADAATHEAYPDQEAVAGAIKRLKSRSDAEIFGALDAMDWRAQIPSAMVPALMNWEQLLDMQASGLVDIGSHTRTHARLTSALPAQALSDEIVSSKARLEDKIQRAVDLFCFPNGDFNPEALALVKETYKAAVTTNRGINQSDTLALHELTRVGIHDDIANTPTRFDARLSGWV